MLREVLKILVQVPVRVASELREDIPPARAIVKGFLQAVWKPVVFALTLVAALELSSRYSRQVLDFIIHPPEWATAAGHWGINIAAALIWLLFLRAIAIKLWEKAEERARERRSQNGSK